MPVPVAEEVALAASEARRPLESRLTAAQVSAARSQALAWDVLAAVLAAWTKGVLPPVLAPLPAVGAVLVARAGLALRGLQIRAVVAAEVVLRRHRQLRLALRAALALSFCDTQTCSPSRSRLG